jgi:hypothetical protein
MTATTNAAPDGDACADCGAAVHEGVARPASSYAAGARSAS